MKREGGVLTKLVQIQHTYIKLDELLSLKPKQMKDSLYGDEADSLI